MVCIPYVAHFIDLFIRIGNGIWQVLTNLIRIIAFLRHIHTIWRMIRRSHDDIDDLFATMFVHVCIDSLEHISIGYAPSICFVARHFRCIVEFIKTLF